MPYKIRGPALAAVLANELVYLFVVVFLLVCSVGFFVKTNIDTSFFGSIAIEWKT